MLSLTVLSWLFCLLPTLAYTSIAILFSIATATASSASSARSLVALLTQLLHLIGKGVIVHLLLPGSAFLGWHGLFTAHRFYGPMVVSSLVSVGWIVACVLRQPADPPAARLRRERVERGPRLAHPGQGRRRTAALVAVLALLTDVGPTGDTQHRLSAAIGDEFNHLTLRQQESIGRAGPGRAQARHPPQLQPPRRRGGRPRRLELQPERLPAAVPFGPLQRHLGRVRREPRIRRLLQGPVAAQLHRRARR